MAHLTDTEEKSGRLVREVFAGRPGDVLGKRSEQLVKKVVYDNRRSRKYAEGAFFSHRDPTGAVAFVSVQFLQSMDEADKLKDCIADFMGEQRDG